MPEAKEDKKGNKKEDRKEIGITIKKEDEFGEWYQQVILKSDFIDYSAVSGCIILKPLAYSVWEKIKDAVDVRLKSMGIQNVYFPLFIPESLLKKETSHVKGFSPEVAWVDYGGDTKLGERLAVRPTSETIMYDSYSRWVKSWRDLPLRLNQWNNVVRWEFKHPVPFIRTREFLWNEGHTAFATKEEAEKEMHDILRLWIEICSDYLALPGIAGQKTESEKFAGAEYTWALEFVTPNGRLVQGPDAHHDGQIFAKAFDIKFLDKDEKMKYAYQNTWAITTRMIGLMVMTHSDNKGLVLPPKLAPAHAVIVPIMFADSMEKVMKRCKEVKKDLESSGMQVILDDREECTPGWKFNDWEMKGMPLRIEIGPKDVEKDQAVLVRRDDGKKEFVKTGNLKKRVKESLEQMQIDLLGKALKLREESIADAKEFHELTKAIKEKKIVRSQWCDNPECEGMIKDKTGGAKIVCIPLDKDNRRKEAKGKCVCCGKAAKYEVYIAKSY